MRTRWSPIGLRPWLQLRGGSISTGTRHGECDAHAGQRPLVEDVGRGSDCGGLTQLDRHKIAALRLHPIEYTGGDHPEHLVITIGLTAQLRIL